MFNETAAKSFYIDYLGFSIDWEHRFRDEPTSDLYMQIRQGDSILHLNGHATPDSPTSEVRIPVVGLQAYCDHLCSKEAEYPTPETVDPRYEGRETDLNMYDPFQNYLVFWEGSEQYARRTSQS